MRYHGVWRLEGTAEADAGAEAGAVVEAELAVEPEVDAKILGHRHIDAEATIEAEALAAGAAHVDGLAQSGDGYAGGPQIGLCKGTGLGHEFGLVPLDVKNVAGLKAEPDLEEADDLLTHGEVH